jgi:hypothetical protein
VYERNDVLSATLGLTLAATVFYGCAHSRRTASSTEVEGCPEFRIPTKPLQISIDSMESRPHARVIAATDGRPVRALLSASRGYADTTHTDSLGRAFLPSSILQTGRLVTRAVGYLSRVDSLQHPLHAGTRLTIRLDAQGGDEGCGFSVPVTPGPP